MRVHFIGICGSGQAAIAIIAKNLGYIVDGCDKSQDGYYHHSLQDNNISVKCEHSKEHLKGVDICAVSPAVLVCDPENEEVKYAKELGILMTWQEFMGRYIFDRKKLICIAGTHGKSTTTVSLGSALEYLNADPSVISGTIYKKWNSGSRVGKSDIFVCEADEFNLNFLNYHPNIMVINNLEMDHPETFQSEEELVAGFSAFLRQVRGEKILVVNAESKLINQLLLKNDGWIQEENIRVIGFHCASKYEYKYDEEVVFGNVSYDNRGNTTFEISGCEGKFTIPLKGMYNVENSVSVLSVLKVLNYSVEEMRDAICQFTGVARRFELVGEKRGISIYDDYAHHPTAIKSVLELCNEIKKREVWVIFEPHQISRILLMFDSFAQALGLADHVIITKTHIGREIHSGLVPIEANKWISAIGSDKALYIEEFDDVASYVCANAQPDDSIIVMGAGESYKISKLILEEL